MGSSLTVALMKADRKIKQDFDKIPENVLDNYTRRDHNPYTMEELRKIQDRDYHQLSENAFYHYQKYEDYWNNGAFLTYQGYMFLKRVCQIVEQYHKVDSDLQTDYYNTNFYFHLQLGEYDKPFMDGSTWIDDKALIKRVEERDQQIKIGFEKKEQDNKLREIECRQKAHENENKSSIPTTATHVIDGSGLRELSQEERDTGQPKEKLEKRWFKEPVNWKKFVLEL